MGICRLQQNEVSKRSPEPEGFTRIDLLVVISILVILILLRLPAYAAERSKSKGSQCLENLRQLTLAWRMYAEDNRDFFLYSSDDGRTSPYMPTQTAVSAQADNYAWTWSKMDFSGANPYNTDPAADMMLRPMWNYNMHTDIYKCPGDTSVVVSNGVVLPRIRTYSMNYYLGGLSGYQTLAEALFRPYTNLADLEDPVRSPGAANTFLFIEERQDIINWGNFLTDMAGYPAPQQSATPAEYQWEEDLPGSYHDRAGGISFCDGHVEIHKWLVASTTPPLGKGPQPGGKWPAPYSADVAWMQNVSVRPH